ncbi:hypothetical protein LSTR_LSTR000730 [Laodelphax striatellus]|uniref:Uncharacterized protein n=1 Tax=Laodelphax striatellus TaxID=195883 RepID=A0A482XHH2_LAOST|nr:hypothetical protein LSTR_LSTR000730 [Laodelphax striatellus]
MSDISSDEDDLPDLPEIAANSDIPRGQVSGWDDDTQGIEEEPNPHENPSKEILWAAERGEMETVVNLIKQNSSVVTATDKDGYTPLHRACYNNHVEIASLLLKHGADLSAKTIDDWQPLHSACKWNSVQCAELLVSKGADVNAVTKGGITPLHLAASNSYASEIMELLLMNTETDVNVKNDSDDLPVDVARRTGKYDFLFDIAEPCFNA